MLERDLYGPAYNYLELAFRQRLKPLYGDLRNITAITASTGGTATGIWPKPDLALIALTRQKYGLSWQIDLHGFEVKPAGTCSVQSVHEALNHTSLVHFPLPSPPRRYKRHSRFGSTHKRCQTLAGIRSSFNSPLNNRRLSTHVCHVLRPRHEFG